MIANNNGNAEQMNDINVNLLVYPNPSEDGKIAIKISNSVKGELLISDIMGRVLVQEQYTKTDDVDLSKILPQGVYIIKYTSEEGKVESKQVFIK